MWEIISIGRFQKGHECRLSFISMTAKCICQHFVPFLCVTVFRLDEIQALILSPGKPKNMWWWCQQNTFRCLAVIASNPTDWLEPDLYCSFAVRKITEFQHDSITRDLSTKKGRVQVTDWENLLIDKKICCVGPRKRWFTLLTRVSDVS